MTSKAGTLTYRLVSCGGMVPHDRILLRGDVRHWLASGGRPMLMWTVRAIFTEIMFELVVS